MLHKKLDREWFEAIANGTKIFEGRPHLRDWAYVGVDDLIEFFCESDSIIVRVIKIIKLNNFQEAVERYGEQLIPGKSHQGEEVYYQDKGGIYSRYKHRNQWSINLPT